MYKSPFLTALETNVDKFLEEAVKKPVIDLGLSGELNWFRLQQLKMG